MTIKITPLVSHIFRRLDRVHIRNIGEELGTPGTVRSASTTRAYVAFDNGDTRWVENKYLFRGEAPEEVEL